MFGKYKLIVVILGVFFVAGCATKMSDFADEDASTMKDVFDGTFSSISKNKNGALDARVGALERNSVDYRGYTRDSKNEVDLLFSYLPNPTLVGYVYPHLTSDGIPIPGYSIPFKMSAKDYFSLPGEGRK